MLKNNETKINVNNNNNNFVLDDFYPKRNHNTQ